MHVCQDIIQHLDYDPDFSEELKRGFLVRPRDRISESPLKEFLIKTDQNSKVIEVQNQTHVGTIFRRQKQGPFSIFAPGSDCQPACSYIGPATFASFRMEKSEICGKATRGCFTTIIRTHRLAGPD